MKKLLIFLVALFILNSSFLIHNCSAQWVPLGGLAGDIMDLAVFNSNIYAGGTASLFRSTNNGNNWTSHFPGFAYPWSIAVSGSNIYCGLFSGSITTPPGVYKSTNNGINWNITSLSDKVISDIVATDQKIIACAFTYDEIDMSTNEGLNWVNIKGSLSYGIYYLAVSGNRIYAGGQGLHVTTNNGVNWSTIFLTDNIESISASDSLIIIGTTAHGVYRSTNNGQNWDRTLNINKRIISVYQYGSYVFAGADTGFYVSTNSGISFFDKTQGLGNASVSSTLIFNNYVFVSNSNYLSSNVSAWRRPLSEVIGIQNISTEIPASFSLSQNYPNPFNPVTKIKFEIAKFGNVRITVFDAMGREVQTLVNESLQPGTYETSFNGSQISSGVYFCKMHAGDFVETKRMLMVK